LVTKYYCGDQIEGDEMGSVCGMYCGEEKRIQIFSLEASSAYRLEDLDLDLRVILKWVLRK